MIVETFNLDEIQKEVLKDYYSAPEKIIINGNTYIAFFGSPTSSLKDFGFQLFLKVLTSKLL